MILADKLIDLRKKNGWSQEDLAEKLEVSRQSISKWEGAQSVPDMNRILKLSEIFGVSTDYLLKDELGPEAIGRETVPTPDTDLPVRQVSMEEATAFLAHRTQSARRIAIGVTLCILSPILLILLCGLSEAPLRLHQMEDIGGWGFGILPVLVLLAGTVALIVTALPLGKDSRRFSPFRLGGGVLLAVCLVIALPVLNIHSIDIVETEAVGFGLAALLLLVAAAVALFVLTGLKGQPFQYLSEASFETAYGVDGMVKDRREKYRRTYWTHMTVGILLCVLSVLPLFLVIMLYGNDDGPAGAIPHICAVAMLLGIVAVGVLLIVHASILWGSYQVLLEEGDYSREKKDENKRSEAIATAYWCAVTAGYLGWSFLAGAWGISWVIWPVAGVLYGVVLAVAKALQNKK